MGNATAPEAASHVTGQWSSSHGGQEPCAERTGVDLVGAFKQRRAATESPPTKPMEECLGSGGEGGDSWAGFPCPFGGHLRDERAEYEWASPCQAAARCSAWRSKIWSVARTAKWSEAATSSSTASSATRASSGLPPPRGPHGVTNRWRSRAKPPPSPPVAPSTTPTWTTAATPIWLPNGERLRKAAGQSHRPLMAIRPNSLEAEDTPAASKPAALVA